MITSSNVVTPWNGSILSKGRFEDKFKVVRKEHNELLDTYEVTVLFYASPDKEYVFEVSEEAYNAVKAILAQEILRQLKSDA